MCACSAREEEQWKSELLQSTKAENNVPAASVTPFLELDLKYITVVSGQPGTSSWRMSMQRAATVDRRTSASQVLIYNTHSLRDGQDSPRASPASVCRSNSLQSACRIPILAPDRAERARLEHALEVIWTKDLLPFPGMFTRRGSSFIRASKHTVIRKLSRASSTTQSSKRSISGRSLEDPFIETATPRVRRQTISASTNVAQDTACQNSAWDSLPSLSEEAGKENSSVYGARKISFRTKKDRGTSDTAHAAEDGHSQDAEEANRLSKPKMLLKAFSADGIKNWFT